MHRVRPQVGHGHAGIPLVALSTCHRPAPRMARDAFGAVWIRGSDGFTRLPGP